MPVNDARDAGPRARRRLGLAAAAVLLWVLVMPPPVHAVHLFPLTPVFDPFGHDCAQNLQAAPETPSAGKALVVGFDFIDEATNSSTTTIQAGESVSWGWAADHCHSVTFEEAPNPESENTGTLGKEGFQPAQPELVRKSVHHASVGMAAGRRGDARRLRRRVPAAP